MIRKPDGIIYLKDFTAGTDDFRKISDGSAVDSLKYTVTASTESTFLVVENTQRGAIVSILTSSDPEYVSGQNISYKDSNGLYRNNKIIAIGVNGLNTIYQLKEDLKGLSTGDSAILKPTLTKIELNDFDQGVYVIEPYNQMLVVRNSFADIYINYAQMTTILPDLKNLPESEFDEMNNEARDLVYSDLAGRDITGDIIADESFREIKIKAILCIFSNRFDVTLTSEQRNYCEEYHKALDSYVTRYKKINDGKSGNFAIDDDASIDAVSYGEWSL